MKMNNRPSALILLSGGLDSVVSLAVLCDKYDFRYALTFDYGQKSFRNEYDASLKIADFYNIKKHECIKLDWLRNITQTALVSEQKIPDFELGNLDNLSLTSQSMKKVWVPNRNGVFINIAAAYADSFKIDYIVIGANKEEAATFTDNSGQFIDDINKALESSTNYNVKVIAPLLNMDKNEIVKKAIELNVPLKDIYSCYNSSEKHCGKCESCCRLKRALEKTGAFDIIKQLFE